MARYLYVIGGIFSRIGLPTPILRDRYRMRLHFGSSAKIYEKISCLGGGVQIFLENNPFFCSLKHMSKQAIPLLPIVRDAVWVGVGSIEHGMQRMIVKQELFDGKNMGRLDIDGNFIG